MLQFRIIRDDGEMTKWSSYDKCDCHQALRDHAEMLLTVNQERNPSHRVDLEWRDTEDVDWPTEIDLPA